MKSQDYTDVATGLCVISIIGRAVWTKFPQVGVAMMLGGYLGAGVVSAIGIRKIFKGE